MGRVDEVMAGGENPRWTGGEGEAAGGVFFRLPYRTASHAIGPAVPLHHIPRHPSHDLDEGLGVIGVWRWHKRHHFAAFRQSPDVHYVAPVPQAPRLVDEDLMAAAPQCAGDAGDQQSNRSSDINDAAHSSPHEALVRPSPSRRGRRPSPPLSER